MFQPRHSAIGRRKENIFGRTGRSTAFDVRKEHSLGCCRHSRPDTSLCAIYQPQPLPTLTLSTLSSTAHLFIMALTTSSQAPNRSHLSPNNEKLEWDTFKKDVEKALETVGEAGVDVTNLALPLHENVPYLGSTTECFNNILNAVKVRYMVYGLFRFTGNSVFAANCYRCFYLFLSWWKPTKRILSNSQSVPVRFLL